MIVFGCVIGAEQTYEAFARPGIERASEPDSVVVLRRERDSIFSAYNEILEAHSGDQRLEAVVLLHDDLEITDERFGAKLRGWINEPDVGVVGAVGARGVRSIAWWRGEEQLGRYSWRGVSDRRKRLGDDIAPAGVASFDWGGAGEDVDSVDGMLLILSPDAARELRFDEGMAPGFHGYDADICFQARAAGKRVIVGDFDVLHHTAARLGEREGWVRAHMEFARKWEGRRPPAAKGLSAAADAA